MSNGFKVAEEKGIYKYEESGLPYCWGFRSCCVCSRIFRFASGNKGIGKTAEERRGNYARDGIE